MNVLTTVSASAEIRQAKMGQEPVEGLDPNLKPEERASTHSFPKRGNKRSQKSICPRFSARLRSKDKLVSRPLVKVTAQERVLLKKLGRQQKAAQRLVRRVQIILVATEEGRTITSIARQLGLAWHTVQKWIQRWQAGRPQLNKLAAPKTDLKKWAKKLSQVIQQILSDAPRIGAPAQFTAEQYTQIIALACEPPEFSNRPISHWTPRELAAESEHRGIVSTISPRTVSRLLAELDLKPHLIRYWLNTSPKDQNAFTSRVQRICALYRQAPELANQNIFVASTDEKTGIQALERTHPTRFMIPGHPEAREFNYKRHGTLNLLASLLVANGQIICAQMSPTRNEQDFLTHIQLLVRTAPEAQWIIIADQLNTHRSVSLVRWIANKCNLTPNLGVKGKSGVLKSMKTRQTFLEDPTHRIRFVFTPLHTSWLNQIELWFGILVRKLLKRSSFPSLEALQTRVLAFIDYFNKTMAKPFRWTYTGRPLKR